MRELIRIQEKEGQQVVSARELYTFLGVKSKFPDWIKRMFEYGFSEDIDFISFLSESTGGRPSEDYALTLDTAKEIAMIQRTDKGKEARQYFIEMEKKISDMSPLEFMRQCVDHLTRQENKMKQLASKTLLMEDDIQLLKVRTATRPDYFTVMGYAIKTGNKLNLALASEIGRKTAKLCNENKFPIDKINDSRYGLVGSYPAELLEIAFDVVLSKQLM